MNSEVLSYSRITTFLKCRQQYDYRYRQKLKPRIRHTYMQRGTLIHRGFEAALHTAYQKDYKAVLANAEGAIHKAFATWIQEPAVMFIRDNPEVLLEHEQLLDESIAISRRAIRNIDIDKGRWDTLSLRGQPLIEYKLETPLPPWKGFVGYIDWAALDRESNLKWIIDFKTRTTMTAEEEEEINLQFSVYQYLLCQENIFLNGSATYQIKAIVPEPPPLLKNGKSLSRAKMSCDWETYENEILKHGFDPAEYAEMKEKLSPLEKFSVNYRTFEEIENTWDVIKDISADMTRPSLPIYRNLTAWNCRSCSYKVPCFESLRGKNIDHILENDFLT